MKVDAVNEYSLPLIRLCTINKYHFPSIKLFLYLKYLPLEYLDLSTINETMNSYSTLTWVGFLGVRSEVDGGGGKITPPPSYLKLSRIMLKT